MSVHPTEYVDDQKPPSPPPDEQPNEPSLLALPNEPSPPELPNEPSPREAVAPNLQLNLEPTQTCKQQQNCKHQTIEPSPIVNTMIF